MLLLLLPLLNSSSVRNFLRPFSKEKSSSSAEDDSACPICLASPTIPFLALPCQHRSGLFITSLYLLNQKTTICHIKKGTKETTKLVVFVPGTDRTRRTQDDKIMSNK